MVLVAGVFDVIHAGHIELFRTIREYACCVGEELCVGVNSDRRAIEIKDNLCFCLYERMSVLNAIDMIDTVYSFDEDTPAELIKVLKPRVYVKGGDYIADELPEKEACDEVGAEIYIIPITEIDGRKVSSSVIKSGGSYVQWRNLR
jgi:D-beta-D-heptose 7-phosphate kinase/D-beta-D-heptose 1-phosphate adenosyltransferase